MLRHGDTLRLTSNERDLLSVAAGRSVNPKTVAEHNAIVEHAHSALVAQAELTETELDDEGVDHSGASELSLLAALTEQLHVH